MTTIWVSNEVRDKLAAKKLRVGEKQSKFETYNDVIERILLELESKPIINAIHFNPNDLTVGKANNSLCTGMGVY